MKSLLEAIRTRLANWLHPPEEDDPYLDCSIPAGHSRCLVKFVITGTMGTSLLGTPISGATGGSRILMESYAVDKARYWKLWKRFNNQKLVWEEDGKEFNP